MPNVTDEPLHKNLCIREMEHAHEFSMNSYRGTGETGEFTTGGP